MAARTLNEFKKTHDAATVIADLRKQLEVAMTAASTADVLREYVGTAKLAVQELQLPKWVFEPKKAKAPGVPKLMLSDLHWGEVVRASQIGGVNSYNLAIASRRLQTVVETTIALCKILDPTMSYPGIVMPLGGDMISGNIHDELAASNELNTMPTLMHLYRNLVPAIQLMADTFGRVFLPCVSGNHDRDTKKIWAKDRNHTSFGWLLYQFLAAAFENDKRVTFYIPDGSDALYRIYGTRYLLTHGDQFRGGDGIIGPLGPVTRGEQKKNTRNAAVGQDYDIMEFGHFHKRMLTARLRGNGSLKGYDEYAADNNFGYEPASQNFWLTHPDHGITFDAPVFGDPKTSKQVKAVNWVSILGGK
jgi:predicted phosphodiesterase